MSRRPSLVSLPGRWMAPLIMVLFAVLASGVNFLSQLRTLQADVVEQETRRLRERLSVEQSRLSFLSTLEDAQQVRRIIGGLGLYTGMQSAYLLAPDGRINASIIRADIGRGFDEVMAQMPAPARHPELFAADRMGIQVRLLEDRTTLVGVAPFAGDRRLVTLVDLTLPKARLRSTLVTEVVRESFLLMVLAALLALLMHRLWFTRASRLVRTLEQVGDGQLQARAALSGRDELASIGNEVDRMAQRLQAQQTELRYLGSLVARSPVVFVEWSPEADRAVRFVSASIEQWQHSPRDLVSRRLSFGDLVHPDDWLAVWSQSEHHRVHGPDEYRQEYRLRTGDGRWIWVEDRSAVDRDAEGRVIGITGILLDITVQKEAQLAQREQAEQLRLFYDLPFIGMAISSPESKRWLQVNDRLCDILGYPRDELLRMTWTEMTPSPDLQNNLALLQQMKDGLRDSYSMHKRFVRKDGQLVEAEIEVRAVRDAQGRLLRLLSTVQDVTERSRANEALRRQTQLLEQAEAIAGLGSWSFDPGRASRSGGPDSSTATSASTRPRARRATSRRTSPWCIRRMWRRWPLSCRPAASPARPTAWSSGATPTWGRSGGSASACARSPVPTAATGSRARCSTSPRCAWPRRPWSRPMPSWNSGSSSAPSSCWPPTANWRPSPTPSRTTSRRRCGASTATASCCRKTMPSGWTTPGAPIWSASAAAWPRWGCSSATCWPIRAWSADRWTSRPWSCCRWWSGCWTSTARTSNAWAPGSICRRCSP